MELGLEESIPVLLLIRGLLLLDFRIFSSSMFLSSLTKGFLTLIVVDGIILIDLF